MKIVQRNPIQSSSVGSKKRTSSAKKGAFSSVMDAQTTDAVTTKDEARRQPRQQADQEGSEVMLMLVRQGIDVLDDGLHQIEREGLLANKAALTGKMGEVRQQLRQLRRNHGANPLLDESETILNVESERLRQLA